MIEQDFVPDKAQLRRAFGRAAACYDEAAVLQREVGERLLGRLDLMRVQPRRILDIGCGTGVATRALMKRYPKAQVVALDLSTAMLGQARRRAPLLRRLPAVCADAERLPLLPGSVDMVFSNLTLQWCHDLNRAFAGFLRCLRPEGLALFSTFGPDTLKELRRSWAAVDRRTHVNAFVDMHDIGDALVRAGFADPVMEAEAFTLTYDSARDLMRDLKTIGAHNVSAGRPRGMTGKRALAAMEAAYEGFRDADGRLPATYEVVYGHAWAPRELPQRRGAAGEAFVPVGRIGRRGRGSSS
jgi:malonyl-CoA O-methyltransferase